MVIVVDSVDMVMFSMQPVSALVDGYIVKNKYWVGVLYFSENLVEIRGLLNYVVICRELTFKNSGTLDKSVSLMIATPCRYKIHYTQTPCDVVQVEL